MKKLIINLLFPAVFLFNLQFANAEKTPTAEKFLKQTAFGFEENQGQIVDENDKPVSEVLYKFEASGVNLFLTKKGFTYVFFKGSHSHHGETQDLKVMYNRVDIDLQGATINKENIKEEFPLETNFNFFTANYPQGIYGVKKYQKLTFNNIYPGIDWVWYVSNGDKKLMKYDFIVHPGANPAQIQMVYKWCDLSTPTAQELLIHTPNGELLEGKAISYSGDNEVATSYVLVNNKVTFNLSDYDKNKDLTIDPPLNLMWGTYFGGNAWEKNTDISNALDANGNVFVAGNTLSSSNFPTLNPGGGTYFQGTYSGGGGIQGRGGDICILKFSNTGVMIWCTYYGGTNHDNGNSVTISPTGELYVAGCSLSSNFPLMVQTGAYNQTYNGGSNLQGEGGDAILIKFTNAGVLQWATFYGGAGNDVARGVETDPSGNVFMTGWTTSTDFPLLNPGGSTYYQATNGGTRDVFFVKLNSSGVQQWSTYYGGNADDMAHYITLDNANNIFVIGETASTDFPTVNPGGGAYFQAAHGGAKDAFIYKANNAGSTIWSTYYGGTLNDMGRGIDCKGMTDIFITGETASTNLPVLNPGNGAYFQGTKVGANDAFFARFQNSGVHLWGTYYGGTGNDNSMAIITDNCGNTYATGNTYSTNFPTLNPGGGAFFAPNNLSQDDVFLVSFDNNNVLQWSTYQGTTGFDEKGTSMKIDQFGNIFVVGYWCFYSTSNGAFNPGGGAYYKTNTDQDDFFVLKFQGVTCTPCSFTAAGTYLCPNGSNTTFSLSSNDFTGYTPAPSFTWTGPGSFTSNLQNPTFPNGAFGAYTITASNGSCTSSQVVTLVNTLVSPVATKSMDINCLNNGVVAASPTIAAPYSYLWQGPGITGATNTQTTSVNLPGNYTVTITNSVTGCSAKSSVAVITDTDVPIVAVTPSIQNITCISGAATFTGSATSPSVNITHYWYSPFSQAAQITPGAQSLFNPSIPGIYTLSVVNDINGCSAFKTVTITSASGFPTFSITSNTNYTIGCVPKNTTTVSITNVVTSIPGTGVTYTVLPPSYAGGTYTFGTNSTFSMNAPGGYTVIVRDMNNGCESRIPVTILQNTLGPQLSVSMVSQVLSCDLPKVTLVGSSTTQNVSYNWGFPGVPGNLVSDTMPVNITINITNTLIATYTLTITDINNACKSVSMVPMYQNLYRPKAAVASATSISCKVPAVTITNISTTGIPPNSFFTAFKPVVGFRWDGPTPQVPEENKTTYIASTPGVYTMTAKDLNNGCTATATVFINDDRDYPLINVPNDPKPFILDCGAKSTTIAPLIGNPTPGFKYEWVAMQESTLSCITCSVLTTNKTGLYNIVVTNTINGCIGEGLVEVITGTLNGDFEADRYSGYVPMDVTFSNISSSSLNSGSITSSWVFGNGTATTTLKGNETQRATYNQPGTYSVTLYTIKGECLDTAVKLIVVNLHSKLEVPNIFTPNGDGVNDFFFLKTVNITSINISIFDRWGQKVYELLDSELINWDGKNQLGKEVADGVYNYVLTAKGTDGEKFEQHGNITLLR